MIESVIYYEHVGLLASTHPSLIEPESLAISFSPPSQQPMSAATRPLPRAFTQVVHTSFFAFDFRHTYVSLRHFLSLTQYAVHVGVVPL